MASKFSISGDGTKSRAIRTTLLTGGNFAYANLLRLGGNLLLTRILFPEAFGIMAIIQVVIAGLNMFSDVGLRMSIIQNARGEDPAFLDTAWVLQVGRGVLLWLATCAMALPVARFYDVPELAQMLPVAGLVAVFQGLNSTKLALANRKLVMGWVTLIELGAATAGMCALVGLALVWESVWALLIGSLVAPLLVMVLSHVALPGRNNGFRFEREAAASLVNFGKYIFLSTAAGFLVLQGDRAMLGKFVSLNDLALYNIALLFASIPILMMRKINTIVLFPLFSSKHPSENATNYRNIARARAMVIAPVIGMLAVLAFIGNDLIVWLYDPRYEAAGLLVVLIAVSQMPLAITGSYAGIIAAAGDSKNFSIVLVANALLRSLAIFLGIIYFGVIGVALAPAVSTVFFYPILVFYLRPHHGWVPRQDVLFLIISCGLAAAALLWNQAAMQEAFAMFGANALK